MRFLTAIALMLSVALSPPAATATTAPNTGELKAAIVYNIIRFTRLPPQPSSRLTMCVLANGETARAFEHLDGRGVPDGRLSIRFISRPEEIRSGCAIAFVQGDMPSSALSGATVTIGDVDRFIDRGGMVELRRFGRQIVFEVNNQAAARKGVQFSARLLNLASVVHQ
ncbi:YfiR family protein [Sphingomonas floccifaciens]|uniref:YfiR family protein n=1 Tax=Sphingomonas floccifaciens TaxID=1844115 RepID=A0ABW4ND95_9SPHN